MYSERDIGYIIQDFLSEHFNFANVELNTDSLESLEEICESYGIEVENIVENN
jgi:hypothetical protein